MDDPSDDTNFFRFVFACVAIAGIVAILSIIGSCHQAEVAMNNGLIQKTDEYHNIIWVKP